MLGALRALAQALRAALAAGDPAALAAASAAAAAAASAGAGEGGSGGELLSRLEGELNGGPLDVTALYNDVAQPLRLWDVCLQVGRCGYGLHLYGHLGGAGLGGGRGH